MKPTFKQVTKTRYVQLVSELAAEIFVQHYTRLTPKVAAALAEKYKQLVHLLFAEGSPAGIKCVLSEQGIVSNILRLPLVPCTPLLTQEIRAELEKVSK